jgi:hypothetical protein
MKRVILLFLIIFFVLASFAPSVYEIANRGRIKPERQFELVHNFYTDYNFYLSRIREGLEGRWTAVERYTSEPHEGSFIHVMYVFMGRAGEWVRVPWHRSGDIYHTARLVLAIALLALIAEFCKQSFRKYQVSGIKYQGWMSILGFLLAVTAGSWPKLVAVVGNQVIPATFANITAWRLGGYMSWWSLMDTLQRISFIPHLLAGQALILFLLIALGDERVRQKPVNWIFLGILAFVLGIIFPPGVIFLAASLGVFALVEFLWSGKKGDWFMGTLLPFIVVLAFAAPALLYLNLMTSFYPWKRLSEFDIVSPLPFRYLEYIQALGPVLPLGIAGLILAVIKKEKVLLSAIAWVAGWVGLLFVFNFVPQQSPLRFSEVMPHVPLAVLTIYLLYQVSSITNQGKLLLIVSRLSLIVLLSLGVWQMYSSYLWQRDFVDHKMRATTPLVPTGSYVMYPLKDFINAIRFVQDNSSSDAVILSETTAGNYIPVYSGRTVFVGHANTVRAEEKKKLVNQFFSGNMNAKDGQQFLANNRIALIFFGPQEKEDGGLTDLRTAYPFLREAYKNSYVVVYKAQ